MIISRTPLRVSFVGGGTDLPAFYHKECGAVLSTTIDKYVYVTINKKFDQGLRVGYSKNEEVTSVDEIEHRVVRETLRMLDLSGGIEITTIADIPSKGTGLGSSSSFTVGLLHALNAYLGQYKASSQLAQESCHIEMERCGDLIGKQDQYAAAYGGFNLMEFNADESVRVSPVICRAETIQQIEKNILLFYTGITRNAAALLKKQQEDILYDHKKYLAMRKMVELTYLMYHEIQKNNIDAFGEILHENWMIKKGITTGISSEIIDQWYDVARKAGASGGKILGAGAGGFLMLFASPEKHEAIKKALRDLYFVSCGFESLGSRIIFYHQ